MALREIDFQSRRPERWLADTDENGSRPGRAREADFVIRNDLTDYGLRITSVAGSPNLGFANFSQPTIILFSKQRGIHRQDDEDAGKGSDDPADDDIAQIVDAQRHSGPDADEGDEPE